MAVTLGPSSVLSIPASAVLSTVLEKGRAEFSGPGRDIVKIQVGEGEIRGGGRLVLWREGERTAAAALEGAFRVSGGREDGGDQGRAGHVDAERPGPVRGVGAARTRPAGSSPAATRSSCPPARAPSCTGRPGGTAHHLEVLALQTDDVLLARNVGEPPVRVEIPWLGTFRWRVSARDGQGLESAPSDAGYVCVVDK